MDSSEKQSRKNPAEKSNYLSLLFFGWTAPIFWKGTKQDLSVTDLYDPLKSDESERLGDRLEREWEKELSKADQSTTLNKDGSKKRKGEPNLGWAIFRMFWAPYMVQGLLLFIKSTVLQLILPQLQKLIVSYFNPGRALMTRSQVLIYTGLLVVVTFSIILITHHTTLRMKRIGMCVRVACCTMVYRKILRLDQAAVSNTAGGQVANLMSNDVARFDKVPLDLHYIWISPIQVSLLGYMMWNSVGMATLVGMGSMIFLTIPVQGYLSILSGIFRSKIAVKTDERVQLMSELIPGIQIVKMYAWEKPFESIVSKVRALEMKFVAYASYLRGFDYSIVMFAQQVCVFCTLTSFVLMGNKLTAEIAYLIVALFVALHDTCTIHLPEAIITAGEAAVSLKRVKEFLLLDEVPRSSKVGTKLENGDEGTEAGQQIERGVGVDIVDVTANWVRHQNPSTLRKISMDVKSQSLYALVGPVGSGKSSLLHLLLGELPAETGRLSFFTGENRESRISSYDIRISYASQDPWLFSASIRDNILFGQPYDKRRYEEVTRVCALHKDFEQLPQGDLCFVGERGACLSGGQRARVNLARAVYREAELYLLDDPLSAVDAQVGHHLFKECIIGFLKDKTRILVTHQPQYLQQSDNVVVLNRGTIECQGTYDELIEANIHILDGGKVEEPDEVGGKNLTTSVTGGDTDDQRSNVSENYAESKDIGEEEKATGAISNKVYWDYFSAGGNLCSLAFLVVIFIIGQVVNSGANSWLSYWIDEETLRATSQLNKSPADGLSYRTDAEHDPQEVHITEWQWADEDGLMRQDIGMYIYTVCVLGSVFFITLRSLLFTRMAFLAPRTMDNVDAGRILNRFSKDVGTMDEQLPRVMLETFQVLTIMLGLFVLVGIANNWMILPTVIVCVFFYLIRRYYLKTAQDVKRLEGVTKSPMFSHANSTLDGLTTIRSRGVMAEKLLRREFDHHQDIHTGAWYLSIATATAFGFFLDLISCAFFACVCFSFILMDDGDTLGGIAGMAITQSRFLIGTAQYGINQSTELVSQLTAVERVLQYTNLPKEGPFTTEKPPPPSWPSKGGLVIKNVTMRYAENKPPVLKNLNLTINPGWKVGIVGRTGAGKSSLISALFRLTGDGLVGEITLDGINTKSVGLHELRPRISIIPQEPVLFSASLRQNLDPFGEYSDAKLWDSLREVELGDAVPSLDFHVLASGANFSVGQRQLICLARAILRNNRLLVLDEATANVDRRTDALIQNTIRRRFADCTVLTIAHRVNTIMDSDRVLVMAEGQIVEFGHPHLLLENRDGHFAQMLQQTGNTTAVKLARIAENAFLLSPDFTVAPNDPCVLSSSGEISRL